MNSIKVKNIQAFYLRDNFLNDTRVLDLFRDLNDLKINKPPLYAINSLLQSFDSKSTINKGSKTILVIGTGHHYLRNKDDLGGIVNWKKTIDNIYKIDDSNVENSNIKLYISPVVPVVKEKLTPVQYETVQSNAIEYMNTYISNKKSSISFPVVWADMVKGRPESTIDGIRYGQPLEIELMNVLHNHMCNSLLKKKDLNNQYFCCVDYPPPSYPVAFLFILFIILLPLIILLQQSVYLIICHT
ncbi:hypothetical protein AYI69_g402 [Smittium culicis]|uniref:Uncharacterized protein n=1 Tax=Smittium culicis TaxID=133412 RepID=A0A1R1YT57_9FUNG|nr:hypothetical protein AYI69_g402 [Smittium culicis]